MALTQLQENRLMTLDAESIARMVLDGRISKDDLYDLASRRIAFAPKLTLVEQCLSRIPDPDEEREYNELKLDWDVFNPVGDCTDMLSRIETYLSRWTGNAAASEHLEEARCKFAYYDEQNRYRLIEAHVAPAKAAFKDTGKSPSRELIDEIKAYISAYGESANVSEDHKDDVFRWEEEIDRMVKETFERDRDLLFDSEGILVSVEAYNNFITKYVLDAEHSAMLDDALWEYSLRQPDVLAAIKEYSRLTHSAGAHQGEVQEIGAQMQQWRAVDKTKIFDVIRFKDAHPDTLLGSLIQAEFDRLKPAQLAEIRTAPSKYSAVKFLALLDSGACSSEELLEAISAPGETDIIQRMRDVANQNINVLPIPAVDTFDGITEGNGKTDIVLFGASSAGKTCFLTGILTNGRIEVTADDWSGRYAQALESYGREQIAPPPTSAEMSFATMIKCKLYLDNQGTKYVPFNLVDMAGAVLTQAIISYDSVQGSMVSFADMGTGATQILSNNHEKIFIIVIDPTAKGDLATIQRTAVNSLLSIMQNEANEDIMRKVRGLHFVVTKADTLGGMGRVRLEAARRVVHDIVNEGSRTGLVRFCREHGINISTDKSIDGRPRVFCYSLGKFFPGNFFSYNTQDSSIMLNMISDYVTAINTGGFLRRARKIYTKRF